MRSEINTDSSYVQNNKFKTLILGRIMFISVFITLFFAIFHVLGLNYIGNIQAISNFVHAGCILPVYLLFKQNKISLTAGGHILVAFCYLTSTTAVFTADHDSFRAIWYFLCTMIAFMFLGRSYGKIYGMISIALITLAGFAFESNINSVSVLNSIISLFSVILIMSAYTGQMERHLNHIDRIQQEIYYLASKSSMGASLTSDHKALEVEQLFKNAQATSNSFSLIYIDVENTCDNQAPSKSFWNDVRAQLNQKLKILVSSSDVISQVSEHLFYIALPNKDALTIRTLANKLEKQLQHNTILVSGKHIELKICMSVTTLRADDESIRALHIRADQGLTKAKAMGDEKIVYVGV